MDWLKKARKAGEGYVQSGSARVQSLRYGLQGVTGGAPVSATEDEVFRSRQGFHEVESSLPKQISQTETPVLDRVLSFALGAKNPIAREADPREEVVWLFDNTAYRPEGSDGAHWEAEFTVAYFARNSGKDLNRAVSNIADKIGVDNGQVGTNGNEAARKVIEKRLRPFALAIRPARYLNVVTGDRMRQLGPGDSNGISTQTVGQLGFRRAGDIVTTSPRIAELAPHGPMQTFFAEPEGWTVISDIDDSIKVTMTASPIGMLQSTFYDQPVPIKGMPELYQQIDKTMKPNWFYLSASPYNLYPFLREFLRSTYPHGHTILREASWQDLDGLLQSFTVGTEAYKSSRIEKIHTWLPRSKVLCVGDSTQSDPEAYGNLARKHPGWIRAIFIRKVTGVTGMDDSTKNTPERFEKAFKDVPRSIWQVFEDPAELQQAVGALTTM